MLQNLVGGRAVVWGHGSARDGGRRTEATDVAVAGSPVVRGRVRHGCRWSWERGNNTTHEHLPINSNLASAPGVLQDIILEQNLRDLLDLVDRTGYTTSDVMYIVEQMDIVEHTAHVDRKG